MPQATLIRKLAGKPEQDARIYRLDPPMAYASGYDDDGELITTTTDYVVVSAVVAYVSGPETYIFAADEAGQIVDGMELPGSFRGGLDHRAALSDAGYRVTDAS